jgi:hypothetical protein
MKMFEPADEIEAIDHIRRPTDVYKCGSDRGHGESHQLDGRDNRPGPRRGQCQAVLGLGGQDDDWYSGRHMANVWFETEEDAAAHQAAMDGVPVGTYGAVAVSPLATGRLDPPTSA